MSSQSGNIYYQEVNLPPRDPRIQFLEIQQQQNREGAATVKFHSADEGYIPVIARVVNIEVWRSLPNLIRGSEIPSRSGEWIVTGRILLSDVEEVRKKVESLKVSQRVNFSLAKVVEEIGLKPECGVVSDEVFQQGGKGVVVGIIDFGCDFHHNHFRNSDGTTRITSIWNQAEEPNKNSPYGYGREYKKEEIDSALKSEDPYENLNYWPALGSHGTHVMDIAAGSSCLFPGIAPEAEIVFVDLSTFASRNIEEIAKKDLGDSVRLIEAVDYIFRKAGPKPCVVNLSLGSNGGPHDGTNPVEKALDALVMQKKNRAVVIAASNTYDDSIHTSGVVLQGGYTDLEWVIKPFDQTYNELEIWYKNGDEFIIEIISPSGKSLQKVSKGKSGYLWADKNGKKEMLGFICHRIADPNNNDPVIHIIQNPQIQLLGGIWTLRLHGKKILGDGEFHAWIERDDQGASLFKNPTLSHTLSSVSCGEKSIVVGSFDAHDSDKTLSPFSSAGPTRDGRFKPEISAPGQKVWAANARTPDGRREDSGTSMAAPVVTGVIARILGVAKECGQDLSIDQIRKVLINSALKSSSAWDSRFGYGRVYARAIQQASEININSNERVIEKENLLREKEIAHT